MANVGPILAATRRRGGTEILGYDTIGGTSGTIAAGYLIWNARFSPTQTGTITQVELYSANSSATQDVKVGIYTDSAGSPSTLIGTETTFTDTGTWSTGWKAFGGLSYAVTAGANYWICFKISTGSAVTFYKNTTASSQRYKADAYANAFPGTASGMTTGSENISLRATNTY